MGEPTDTYKPDPNSTTRKFDWNAPNKVLTGTFQVLERVSLITTNLVVLENGIFTLKPMVTQIRVENPAGAEMTSIFLDANWANRKDSKDGEDGQDKRIAKIKGDYIKEMKEKGVVIPENVMFGGVNDDANNAGGNAHNVIPEGGEAENNLMFGGGIGNLDLSSSIRSTKNIGVKYHKGKTEKCVEQCIRRNSSSRRTRRRPKPKAKQHK